MNVTFEDVTSISSYAFFDCNRLASVTIRNGVSSIGDYAFYRTGLASVTIGNGVTSIEKNAFSLTKLTSVTIPSSVKNIGETAFSINADLTSVTIGNGVTGNGQIVFVNCPKLTSVTFGSGVELSINSFQGGLFTKYSEGGPGRYTTTAPVGDNSVWTKQ